VNPGSSLKNVIDRRQFLFRHVNSSTREKKSNLVPAPVDAARVNARAAAATS
jgi:hypothetical protein